MKTKNLLFITWDGPQTSYMEGLFMPIFQEIARTDEVKFHVIQFTWASVEKTAAVQKVAAEAGIIYTALPILRKPVASLGSFYTVFTASKKIKKYIQHHQIDIVMPRSTFPAMIVNKILGDGKITFKGFRGKLIFDADGLPLEERVDFAGLKKESRQYRWLKAAETKMLKSADAVITRSQKSINIHVQTIGELFRSKFSVVKNGRDTEFFKMDIQVRNAARQHLNVTEEEKLFVYCGSLGQQYCFEEMKLIFNEYLQNRPAKWLILTGNTAFATENLGDFDAEQIIVKNVPFTEIPFWLNAADVAFALRKPTFSMQGVAPIKLGEYLLMGIPTIASAGIGDTEEILRDFNDCFLYQNDQTLENQLAAILKFIESLSIFDGNDLRRRAIPHFSLAAAAKSYKIAIDRISE